MIGESEVLVLYGSETGNAESVAQIVANELKRNHTSKTVRLLAMDDLDFDELRETSDDPNYHLNIIFVVSTCGQGEYPKNCKYFMADLKNCEDNLSHVNYCVFGLGDSQYVYFNETAKDLDDLMNKLGAKQLITTALGDDQDRDQYDTAFEEWLPNVLMEKEFECNTDTDKQELMDSKYNVNIIHPNEFKQYKIQQPPKYISDPFTHDLGIESNIRVTPDNYDRDFRQYTFRSEELDTDELIPMTFDIGDCLGIYVLLFISFTLDTLHTL